MDKEVVTPLDATELIDLFKHWDTRVSHQELLYVPLVSAGLPAVAATWTAITPKVVLAVAVGSIALYLYHLLAIQRIAAHQDHIFARLSAAKIDFASVVAYNGFGVRQLRILGLPFLTGLWLLMLWAKLDVPLDSIPWRWWAVWGILFFGSGISFINLWRKTPAKS